MRGGLSSRDEPAGWARGRLLSVFLAFRRALLVLPLLQTLHPSLAPLFDRSRRASRPPTHSIAAPAVAGDRRLRVGLNKWFDDRAGFREPVYPDQKPIDYSIFSTLAKLRRLERLAGVRPRQSGLFRERLDASGLAALEAKFLNLHAADEKGARLVVIGYPDKARMYPAMLRRRRRFPRARNADKLRQFLSQQSALTFIDAERDFPARRVHIDDALYYKTDSCHAPKWRNSRWSRDHRADCSGGGPRGYKLV